MTPLVGIEPVAHHPHPTTWPAPQGFGLGHGSTYGAPYSPSASLPVGDDRAVEALGGSKLLAQGGFQVVPQLFSKPSMLAMFEEARQLFGSAKEEMRNDEDDEDWRGGLPPRRFFSSGGGPVQDALYQAPALQAMLSELIGTPVRPSSNRASYSYYCRPGDHLALHRDVERCDISVIVVVSENTKPHEPGGELVVYPDYIDDPLSTVRRAPERGAVPLKLAAGETLILAGGMVPHVVRPVVAGQYRITAPLCFQAVAEG